MKIRLQGKRFRAGVSFIETIVYLAVLLVVLSLSFVAYYRFDEQSRRLRKVAADIERAQTAGEKWRSDIRAAKETIQWDDATQELKIQTENGAIVYRLNGSDLERSEGTQFLPFLQGINSSKMSSIQREHVRAWRWEVELKPQGQKPRTLPLFQFDAVSGEEAS